MKKLLWLLALAAAANAIAKRIGKRDAGDAADAQNAAPVALLSGDVTEAPTSSQDDATALSELAAFDAQQYALADHALGKPLGREARAYATMLFEEHRDAGDRVRALARAVGAALAESAPRLDAFAGVDDGAFEEHFIAASVDAHARMLDQVDNVLLPTVVDSRIAEHLQLVRDDPQVHLENARLLAQGAPQDPARAA